MINNNTVAKRTTRILRERFLDELRSISFLGNAQRACLMVKFDRAVKKTYLEMDGWIDSTALDEQIVELRLNGMMIADIADKLNVTIGAVNSTIRRRNL